MLCEVVFTHTSEDDSSFDVRFTIDPDDEHAISRIIGMFREFGWYGLIRIIIIEDSGPRTPAAS